MSDVDRVLSSVPVQVRRVSGVIETDGVTSTINFAEMWIIDENHHDGFRVLCGLDIDAGTILGAHGDIWSR